MDAPEVLADGDIISVRIAGWEPGVAIGVSQCEDPDDPDNRDLTPGPDGLPPGEVCNILGLTRPSQTETAGDDGVVAFDYEVKADERMTQTSAEGVCGPHHDCRLHVFLSFILRFRSDAPRVSIPLTFA